MERAQNTPSAQPETVLRQNLSEEGNFSGAYFMRLLFSGPVTRPDTGTLHKALCDEFGAVDIVTKEGGLSTFALCSHLAAYQGGQKLPSQLLVADVEAFDQESVDTLARSQCWDAPDSRELLEKCTHELKFGDFMAGALPYKERADILYRFMDRMLCLFPDALLLQFMPSAKLLTPAGWKRNPFSGELRVLHGCMNLRLFNVQGKEKEQIVDSLGLFALGLPDVQCHFHGLPTGDVVKSVCDVAAYLFSEGDIIADGETVPGLGGEEYCRCRHERSVVQPQREVLDLNEGRFAAGTRKNESL